MLKGYVTNEKKLEYLNRIVEILPRIVIFALEFEREDGYKVVTEYTRALIFLMITIINGWPVLKEMIPFIILAKNNEKNDWFYEV